MNRPALVILGYSEAAMFLRREPAPAVTGGISIRGGREFGVELEVPHRLDLTFDDVETPAAGDAMGVLRAHARRRWAAENGLVEVGPAAADVAAIVRFAEETREAGGVVLCHW